MAGAIGVGIGMTTEKITTELKTWIKGMSATVELIPPEPVYADAPEPVYEPALSDANLAGKKQGYSGNFWKDFMNALWEGKGEIGTAGIDGFQAWADGVIPIWDPFEGMYNADAMGFSRGCGVVSQECIWTMAGSGVATKFSGVLAKSKWVGKGSKLFGRGGQYGQKGILNSGRIRTGWGWKGTRTAGRDVFRTSWSKAGNRTWLNHLDWF